MKDEVEAVLESIRPMLMNDGGNVELVDIDDGVVKVRLVGACTSCSSSTMTLKMGIEKALKKSIPMEILFGHHPIEEVCSYSFFHL